MKATKKWVHGYQPSSVKRLAIAEIAWICGLLQADGYINSYSKRATFELTQVWVEAHAVHLRLKSVIGAGRIKAYQPTRVKDDGSKRQVMSRFRIVARNELYDLLVQLKPYPEWIGEYKHGKLRHVLSTFESDWGFDSDLFPLAQTQYA